MMAVGAFYEPACQVSSLVVAASNRQRQTSSECAPALHQPRAVRANGFYSDAVVKHSATARDTPAR